MFQERYIIENRYKMPGKSISGYYKPVTDPFNSYNFQRRIFFQITAEFGNVHIKITAVEEIIIAPEKIENIFSINDLITILI